MLGPAIEKTRSPFDERAQVGVRDERRLGVRHPLLGPALSHVQCYVPRNTTRASTAFTP
jgi:hypothetical protein